jgi:hypothetical protein
MLTGFDACEMRLKKGESVSRTEKENLNNRLRMRWGGKTKRDLLQSNLMHAPLRTFSSMVLLRQKKHWNAVV